MDNHSVLIFGKTGQLARALQELLPEAIALGREEADFMRPETLPFLIEKHSPQTIFNAVAYTQVDKAETEAEAAFLVNEAAPAAIARKAAALGIPFVHFSTDYVFDGGGNKPWREDDPVNPLNIYGKSKLAGEIAVANAGGKYLIFRTSWVYDFEGKNFYATMKRLGQEREILRVVADQYGAPTYAPHLAQMSVKALQTAMQMEKFPSGVYNLCGGGETSWYGFAEAIFASLRKKGVELKVQKIEPISSSEYPTPAQRPHNSRLDCGKAAEILGVKMPDWQEELFLA